MGVQTGYLSAISLMILLNVAEEEVPWRSRYMNLSM